MNINFSNFDHSEKPVLILKTASNTTIGVLSNAANVSIDVKYNEVSTLEFKTTDRINGDDFEYYDDVVGMRIVELVGVGQFILMNPKEVDNGDYRTKTCKCMSLEYEFTRKKITLPKDTYPLWSKNETSVLSMIMEQMPTWSIGDVPDSLKNKYRTFEVNNENLYNFIKGTVQQSYGCIFEFDTISRKVNIVDANIELPVKPVVISTENLAKEIEIEELTDDVHTRIDVTGAEGVDIRSVNPSGNNKLINLDYFMNSKNFSDEIIDKYMAWKADWHNNRLPYYYLSVEYTIEMMRKQTESAALTELNGEFTNLENQRAVIIQSMAMKLSSQSELDQINMHIVNKRNEIVAKKNIIAESDAALQRILSDMTRIQEVSKFENHFTQDELDILSVYIKDGEISDSSFATSAASDYSGSGMGASIDYMNLSVSDSNITKTETSAGTTIYDIRGGDVNIAGDIISSVVSAAIEVKSDNTGVISFRLGSGVISGDEFNGANVTVTADKITVSFDAHEDPEFSGYITGTNISVDMESAYRYFTKSTTEYDNQSVSLELMEHGLASIEKLAWPSYTFHVDSANFLTADDYARFRDELSIGRKIYVVSEKGRDLSPICIGVFFRYDDLTSLNFEFSDTFSSNDSSFKLVDLLNKSISMGKDVDVSKYVYSEFVDSGANTHIKEFMTSALDVAKNAIMSSSAQAIAWDGAGFRLRKWANDERTSYDDEQIWMNNNSIMMTDDGWETAKMAIGKFFDEKLDKTCWGIVAPMIVGTLLAGSSLIIESAKKDGETAVFRMDEDGCRLYNSQFDIHNELAHITLDPELGVVMGKYPVYSENKEDGKSKIINDDNANFWVDTDGNIHMRGTLHGANGEFTGAVVATSLKIRSNGQDVNIDDYVTGGVNSNSVDSVDVMYYLSSSENELVGGKWSTLAPAWINGWYMWTKMVTKYTNGTSTESDPVNLTGSKGDSGESGRGVADLTEEYYLSTSKTACVGGQWQATSPTWVENTYIWTRIKITYSDNNVDYTTPVCDTTWEAVTALSEKTTTSFEIMDKKIESKVETTIFDELGEVVSQHGSQIEQMPEKIHIAVSEVQVGGRNYILGTGTPYTAVGNGSRQWLYPWRCASSEAANRLFGNTVTISFDYDAAITSGSLLVQTNILWWGVKSFGVGTESNHFSLTRKYDAAVTADDIFIYIDGAWTGSVTFSNVKVEIGDKATDWTPAPEDAEGAISKVSAELALMPDKIRMAVEGIDIGGRNLLQSNDILVNNGWLGGYVADWYCRNGMRIGFGSTGIDTTKDRSVNFKEIIISPGDYTISFYAWQWNLGGAYPTLYFDLKSADGAFEQNVIVTTLEDTAYGGSIKKYTGTLHVDTYAGKVKPRFIVLGTFSSGDIGITEWKLERGNKATDWTPAPEDTDGAIDELSAQLSVQAGAITANATKIETVGQAAGNAQNAANAAQGTANGAVTRVTTAEQSISALDEAVRTKVSQTDFNVLGKKVSENTSAITQTATAIRSEVASSVSGLQTQIEQTDEQVLILAGKTVGGRNYVLGTAEPYTATGTGSKLVLHAWKCASKTVLQGLFGKEVTVSFDYEENITSGSFNVLTGYTYHGIKTFDSNSGSGHLTKTFTLNNGTAGGDVILYIDGTWTGSVTFSNVKVEIGNTATDWTPAPEDAAKSVDAGGVVRVDQTGVHMSGGTIEMETSDGDEYIHIRNDGISASSLSAPNVAKRYSGPTGLYVNPNATSAQIAAGNYFRSLSDALATVNNRMLDYNVFITMASGMSDYTDAVISGVYGDGAILIYGENATVYGTVTVRNSHAQVHINSLHVAIPSGVERAAYEVRNAYLSIYSSTMSGNHRAFTVDVNGYLDARSCVFRVNAENSAYVLRSTASFEECIGNGRMLCHRGNMTAYGKVPIGGASYWESCVPNNLSSLIPTGTDGTPAAPVIQTASWNYLYSDSYGNGWGNFSDDDVRQGYIASGQIYGVMWFDAAAIRSALSGKTIKQVSLRLHMHTGVGRSQPVSVQLYGANVNYSNRVGRPETTKSYGTIGTTEPGAVNEITIPAQAVADMVSGATNALVLLSDDTALYKDRAYSQNYARFSGSTSADGSTCPRLTVVYQ